MTQENLRIIIQMYSEYNTVRITLMDKESCDLLINHHIDRMNHLCDQNKVKDAKAVYSEIKEWVIQKENLEVLTLDYIEEILTDF